MTLSARINLGLSLAQSATDQAGNYTAQQNAVKNFVLKYADGAGAGQANVHYIGTRTLIAEASENLDLAGSLANLLGSAVFARVKAILVLPAASNKAALHVIRPESSGLAGVFLAAGGGAAVPPGGVFMWGDVGATGVPVTASTGDLLTVTNASATDPAEYYIAVLGAAT